MNISENDINQIGEIAEGIEHCLITMSLPIDNKIHIDAMKALLPDFVKELKEIYISTTGENPWE